MSSFSKISFIVPTYEATLQVGSTLLDSINEFDLFLLFCIGTHANYETILDTIELGDSLLTEELMNLSKWGLITSENVDNSKEYRLTSLGEKYFRTMNCLDFFNNRNEKISVNAFNGRVVNMLYENNKDDKNDIKLPQKIIKELYKNSNIANSKDFLLSKFSNIFFNTFKLEEDEINSLETRVKIGKFYSSRISIDLKSITELKEESKVIDICIQERIIKAIINVENKTLNKYRNSLIQISDMQKKYPELFSQNFDELMKLFEEEKNKNYRLEPIYLLSGLNKQFMQDEMELIDVVEPPNKLFKAYINDNCSSMYKNLINEVALREKMDIPDDFDISFIFEKHLNYNYLLDSATFEREECNE